MTGLAPELCTGGLPCERLCPVRRIGRVCPDVAQILDELTDLGLTPADVRYPAEAA